MILVVLVTEENVCECLSTSVLAVPRQLAGCRQRHGSCINAAHLKTLGADMNYAVKTIVAELRWS